MPSTPFGAPPFQGIPPFVGSQAIDTTPDVLRVDPLTGTIEGGTAVTVYGRNFIPNSLGAGVTVLFDGVPATSVVVVDRQTITCVTPAGTEAGLVDVSVTNTYGQTGIGFGVFTYYAPTITRVVPAYGPLSGGTTVTLEGFNFDPAKSYSVVFGDQEATGVTVIDEQHIVATTPAHAVGFVDVILYTPSSVFDPTVFDPSVFATDHIASTEYTRLRNGFQYTLLTRGDDIRRTPGIVIHDTLNNAPNTCTFRVDGRSNAPVYGEKIEIIDSFDGNRRLFAGLVQKVTIVFEEGNLAWDVQCVDFTWLLNKIRPVGYYRNTSASDVIKDLTLKYGLGFTTNHVQTNLAKITIVLDGSKDMQTVFSTIAQMIGGGHWYVDYDMDVHFFHVVPTALTLPPSVMPSFTQFMTVTEGNSIGTTFTFNDAFYTFRHSFVYSDGSESALQAISNVLFLSGTKQVILNNIPLGVAKGAFSCVKRRIYYAYARGRERSGFGGVNSNLETWFKYAEIGDNTTTTFTSDFGASNPSVTSVVAISSDTSVPNKPFSGHAPGPDIGPQGVEYYSVAQRSETQADLAAGFGVGCSAYYAQAKVACLYRDGSISFPSPASNSFGSPSLIQGRMPTGYTLTGIPIGVSLNGNDVVARIVYLCAFANPAANGRVIWRAWGTVNNPPPVPPLGTNFGNDYYLEPDWAPAHVSAGALIIPDNTSTSITNLIRLTDSQPGYTIPLLYDPPIDGIVTTPHYGYSSPVQTPYGLTFTWSYGDGMRPYDNANVLSSDPIPIWPNPDGPSLEDDDPPDPITDTNPLLLRDPPFGMSVDISQVRNRVKVVGARTVVTTDAAIGATQIFVADITTMSPSGGQVRIINLDGTMGLAPYNGVSGVTGKTAIDLSGGLPFRVTQGAVIANFFQADHFESQRLLGKAELDVNGKPTDGIHEFVIDDPSLKATFQLYMRAYAELELFAMPIVSISYGIRDPKHRSGQTVHVDLTNPPCQGDFLIQDVTIDQIHDESDNLAPRYNVIASTVRFELTDLLLQILQNTTDAMSSAGIATSSSWEGQLGVKSQLDGNVPIYRSDLSPYLTTGFPGMAPRVTLRSGGAYQGAINSAAWQNSDLANFAAITTVNGSLGASDAVLGGSGPLNRHYQAYTATPGNLVSVRSTNEWCALDWNPFTEWIVSLHAVGGSPHPLDNSTFRFWLTISDVGADISDADSQVARKGIGMRYSQRAGDLGFVPWSGNGAVETFGSSIGNPMNVKNAVFTISLRVLNNGANFIITVNGVSSASQVIPAGALATRMRWAMLASGGAGSNWIFCVARGYIETD